MYPRHDVGDIGFAGLHRVVFALCTAVFVFSWAHSALGENKSEISPPLGQQTSPEILLIDKGSPVEKAVGAKRLIRKARVEVRKQAVHNLMLQEIEKAEAALMVFLLHDPEPSLRKVACKALGTRRCAEIVAKA